MASRTHPQPQAKSVETAKPAPTTGQPKADGSLSGLLQRAQADPGSLTRGDVMALQRSVGNGATGELLGPVLKRSGLRVGPANDRYEQEADRVARQVVSQTGSPPVQRENAPEEELQMKPQTPMITPLQRKTFQKPVQRESAMEEELQMKPQTPMVTPLQRKAFQKPVQRESTAEEELQMKPQTPMVTPLQRKTFQKPVQRESATEEELQMKPLAPTVTPFQRKTFQKPVQRAVNHGLEGGEVEASVAQQIQRASGGGRPLEERVQGQMEQGFGADFSGVRVHTGQQADTLNRSLNARAFTVGKDVFFKRGEYNPGSSGGQDLIAHELTHTVQQGAAGVQRESADEKAVQTKPLATPQGTPLQRKGFQKPAVQRQETRGSQGASAGERVAQPVGGQQTGVGRQPGSGLGSNWIQRQVTKKDDKILDKIDHQFLKGKAQEFLQNLDGGEKEEEKQQTRDLLHMNWRESWNLNKEQRLQLRSLLLGWKTFGFNEEILLALKKAVFAAPKLLRDWYVNYDNFISLGPAILKSLFQYIPPLREGDTLYKRMIASPAVKTKEFAKYLQEVGITGEDFVEVVDTLAESFSSMSKPWNELSDAIKSGDESTLRYYLDEAQEKGISDSLLGRLATNFFPAFKTEIEALKAGIERAAGSSSQELRKQLAEDAKSSVEIVESCIERKNYVGFHTAYLAARAGYHRILVGEMDDDRRKEIANPKILGGGVNKVYETVYETEGKEFRGFFKPEQKPLTLDKRALPSSSTSYGIKGSDLRFEHRAVAMYRLDQLLGTNVIPRTEFAMRENQFGTVMAMVKGQEMRIYDEDQGWGINKKAVSGEEYENPKLRSGLSNLQLLDALSGQLDRHLGNIMVEKNEMGEIVKVWGIDNDQAFAPKHKKAQKRKIRNNEGKNINVDVDKLPDSNNQFMDHYRGIPEYIDKNIAERILELDPAKIHDAIADLLSKEEIDATLKRFTQIQEYIRSLKNQEHAVDEGGKSPITELVQYPLDNQSKTQPVSKDPVRALARGGLISDWGKIDSDTMGEDENRTYFGGAYEPERQARREKRENAQNNK